MTNLKKLFSEFIKLSYSEKNQVKPSGLRDITVVPFVIARITKDGCRIIYLNNGNQFFIPWEWLDLFSSLSTHSGSEIDWNRKENTNDSIEDIIYYFLDINRCISRCISNSDSELFLETLGNIYSCGTEKFRKWCKSEFKIELKPIEFISLNEDIEI